MSFKDVTKGYLPEGSLYYFFDDSHYAGSQEVFLDFPLNYLPVFVKGGALLALQDSVDHTGTFIKDYLYIHAYKGEGVSRQLHYEDSGEGDQEGAFLKREFILDSENLMFTMGTAEWEFNSQYATLVVFFYGFDTSSARIDGSIHPLEHKDVSFLKKISNFDPLPSGKHPYHVCKKAPYFPIENGKNQIDIELVK